VYGYDPYISVDAAWNLSRSIHHAQNIDEIYRECDFITIHVPLNDSTKGMIGKEQIDQMKDGVVLLNFARDTLVKEKELVEALKSGKVRKYVTDFANLTVTEAPNTLITPHLGASTEESEENCAIAAVREIRDFLENGNIKNSVNYPAMDMGVCTAEARITICHMNKMDMLRQFTSIVSSKNVNVANMIDKSRGDYAYTIIDLDGSVTQEMVDELNAIDGVLRVRVIK
ncbi:MAG: 3-phosphoglycerate dehydrogenase, partial [Eubacterium sp.]|nr:3-phosphoglycerate dehydrogenase [Eubacterium sp.]